MEPHRTLKRQLRKCQGPDGTIDVERLIGLVSLTYQEDEDDRRRTDRSIQLMAGEIEYSNNGLAVATGKLRSTLESMQHGIMMVSAGGIVEVANHMACELLGLPERFAAPPYPLSELIAELGEANVALDEHNTAVLEHVSGRIVEIHQAAAGQGGIVLLIEDITADRQKESALRRAESEYRSLFENSVYGIYRDTLEGQPLRANPALAEINGYASEREHIEAVDRHGGNWYVEPGRAEEFRRILDQDGRVKDLVSEVYRHATSERLWITENAWLVRDENGVPVCIEGTIQDATERISAENALNQLANIDGLTGAKSRNSFMSRLARDVLKPDSPFVLYCVDLDMFKDVNDVFGHAAGDAVLRTVSERLVALAGPQAIVARLGGDEFAILSSFCDYTADPEWLARAIVEAMRVAVEIGGRNHYLGASVGIAEFPRHGDSAEALLKHADTALYEAKAAGRNGWRLFDHQLRMSIEHRKEIENNLRGAIAKQELSLHYQAIVEAETLNVSGFEGLMRWNNPALGETSPAEFIPVAEQSGLMIELGAWAISRACEESRAFGSQMEFSVNVSANQFRSPGFLAHIEGELGRFNIAPQRMILEITESVLVSNRTAARNMLFSLNKLGVQIAIDDFGTGYSSLGYLQHLPIAIVKIDQSFVAGMLEQRANRAVIRAVLGIGRDLGIKIVAEGVETIGQAKALRDEGCQFMQGFLFSRPKPLTEAISDLATGLLGGQPGVHPLRKKA